jgi:RHS repeat-associated protein
MIANMYRQRAKGVKTVLRWLGSLMLLTSLPVFAQSTNSVTYVYTDPQGTPLAEADASGNITATFEYTPYGTFAPNGTSNPGQDPKGPGYTGHVNDPETNLVYMQARYYDPATGRFLSEDPVAPEAGNEFGFNRYDYGDNNPIANIDPTGKFPGDLGGDAGDEVYNAQFTGSGSGSPRSGQSSTQASNPSVISVFEGYKVDAAGNVSNAPIPPAMVKALQKILTSPTGQRIAKVAMNENKKIGVALIPSTVNPRYQWDPTVFKILYTLNLAGFVSAYDKHGELAGAGLDTVIIHEMGHTPYAAKAFGYPYQAGYWQNEFNAVNYVENPYRMFIGLPERTTYAGVPVPPPSGQ